MPRKKSLYLDGFSSDSGGSSDDGGDQYAGMTREEREEAELMNGYGKKRKRSSHKARYDDNNDDDGDAEARGKVREGKQTNYLRGQTFVPASATGQNMQANVAVSPSQSGGSIGSDDEDEEEGSPEEGEGGQVDEDMEQQTSVGGIGSTSRTTSGFTLASFRSSRAGIGSRRQADQGADREQNLDGTESSHIPNPTSSTTAPGIDASRGGVGSSRGGIGSSSLTSSRTRPAFPAFAPSTLESTGVPAAFGAPPSLVEPSDAFAKTGKKSKQTFLPSERGASIPSTSIKFGGGLGGGFNPAAYLASMGWTGGGLGEDGAGMLNPIEVQLRPERAGIAFGGRKERTKQAKEEAKRRGEEVSSDEDDRAPRKSTARGGDKRKKKEKQDQTAELRQAWTSKEKKPRKPRVEHRTYEQIIEEAGGAPISDAGVGQIIDARSKEMKEVASLASALAHHDVPTSDSTKLPELRHNLRLIADNSKQTLDALAREGAGIFERRRWLQREHDETRRRKEKEAIDLARLRTVLSLVKELESMGKQSVTDSKLGLEAFDLLVARLQKESDSDIEKFGLDEALVGAIAPTMKRILSNWSPLEEPQGVASILQRWKRALRALGGASSASTVEVNAIARSSGDSRSGARVTTSRAVEVMLPFEALLWHLWMPRIRSALNNDWKVHHPRAAVAVLTLWQSLLPRYIWDNLLDQILLPKVRKAVADWEPRTARVPLHHLLFPWLPLLGERLEETMSDARRRIRSVLKTWRIKDQEGPQDLDRWREFFPKAEWDSMFLTLVVPKLSSYLSSTFSVNPRSQDLAPLEKVLLWRHLLRRSVFSRLLESEVFSKWLTTLHTWLIQPGVDLGEVAKWYSFWKAWFPKDVADLPGIQAAFKKGISLINQAMQMGEDRRGLPMPDLTPLSRSISNSSSSGTMAAGHASSNSTDGRRQGDEGRSYSMTFRLDGGAEDSISFRSIVEDRAAELDLLVHSLNRSHPKTGASLLRISQGLDGKGSGSAGATFYIREDIVWVEEKDQDRGTSEWVPVGVEELMKRARAKR